MPEANGEALRRTRRMALVSWVVVCAALVTATIAMNAAPVTAANADVAVGQGGNLFAPASVTVNVGDTVTWNWVDGFHNVDAVDGSFNSGAPHGTPGAPFAATFNTAGTFFYYCEVHATAADATDAGIAGGKMVGKVVVQAAQATATATATTTATSTATATGTAATPTLTATPTATSTPSVPKTGQAGLAEGSTGTAVVVLLLGLTVAAVAGARVLSRRER